MAIVHRLSNYARKLSLYKQTLVMIHTMPFCYGIPQRTISKLSPVTTVHTSGLTPAGVRISLCQNQSLG